MTDLHHVTRQGLGPAQPDVGIAAPREGRRRRRGHRGRQGEAVAGGAGSVKRDRQRIATAGIGALRHLHIGGAVEVGNQLVEGLGQGALDCGLGAGRAGGNERPDGPIQGDGGAGGRIDGEGDSASGFDARGGGRTEEAGEPKASGLNVKRGLELALVGDGVPIGVLGVTSVSKQGIVVEGLGRRQVGGHEGEAGVSASHRHAAVAGLDRRDQARVDAIGAGFGHEYLQNGKKKGPQGRPEGMTATIMMGS